MRDRKFWITVAAGLAIGAGPWVLYNIKDPLASLRGEWGAMPATSLRVAASNTSHLLTYKFPALVADRSPVGVIANRNTAAEAGAKAVIVAIYTAAMLFTLIRLAAAPRQETGSPLTSGMYLAWMILLACALLNVGSQFGQIRGLTVRYVLPAYLGLLVVLAVSLATLIARWRILGLVILVLITGFNLSGYYWPWTRERMAWRNNLGRQEHLIAYLERTGTECVFGDYWSVYPVNFDSRLRILGVPYQRILDYHDYASRLPDRPATWRLVAGDAPGMASIVRTAGLTGRMVALAPGVVVFEPVGLPVADRNPRRAIARLQQLLAPHGE